jgi:geranylgeranyl pyrophosphate synthase
VLQLVSQRDTSTPTYLEVIKAEACCSRESAYGAGRNGPAGGAANFGMNLGIAFQLVDARSTMPAAASRQDRRR